MSRIDIVLIRHGWSEGNEKRLLYGRLDVPLTEGGIEQLVKYRKVYSYPETDRYYSSPLLRARETFNTIYEGRKLDGIRDGFLEIDFGDAEGKPESYAGSYRAYFEKWSRGERLWNGETIDEMRARTDRALRDLLDELYSSSSHSATVVCHSCTIKTILMNLGFMSLDVMSVLVPQGKGFRIGLEYDGVNITPISCVRVPLED